MVSWGRYGERAPRSAGIAPWTSPMMTELSPPLFNTGHPICLASLPDTGVGLWARPPAGPGNWMLPRRQDLHGSHFSVSSWVLRLAHLSLFQLPWWEESPVLSKNNYQIPTGDGEGHGNPLQYSFLDNARDRGAWQATVHRVAYSWTRL